MARYADDDDVGSLFCLLKLLLSGKASLNACEIVFVCGVVEN